MTEGPTDYGEALSRFDYQGVFCGRPGATFAGVSRARLDQSASFARADVAILGAPFDGGTSARPGARFGPQAIRLADYLPPVPYRPHLELGVDPFSVLAVVDLGDVAMPPGDIEASLARLEDAVAEIAKSGALPIVLGGDHSVALADMSGVARVRGRGSFAVVHLDAHADTGEASDFGEPLGHGTCMRRLLERGVVRADRFHQLGLRGYWPEPKTLAWAEALGVRAYTMATVDARGLGACLEEILGRCADTQGVFLSIDIDVVDPAMAPGTGTPEPGGLTSRELLAAVRRCAAAVDLVGAEIVEVAPPLDGPGQPTAALANRVVLEILAGQAQRRLIRQAQSTAEQKP